MSQGTYGRGMRNRTRTKTMEQYGKLFYFFVFHFCPSLFLKCTLNCLADAEIQATKDSVETRARNKSIRTQEAASQSLPTLQAAPVQEPEMPQEVNGTSGNAGDLSFPAASGSLRELVY